eukprot:scaffold12880_cov155-Skeletonema_dohrnii-CCMP3373.AAC.8
MRAAQEIGLASRLSMKVFNRLATSDVIETAQLGKVMERWVTQPMPQTKKMMKNEEAVPMMMSAKIDERITFYSRQALYALGTARRPSCYWLASYLIDSFDNASQALLDDLFYLANSP